VAESLERAQRRERPRQSLAGELVQSDRLAQIAQTMDAEIDGLGLRRQGDRRGGREDLAARTNR